MEYVSFNLAKKLKEKGFSCNYPLAMYDEGGKFHPLYTSAEVCYYDFDDFDDKDTFCPTIEQVLTWLRRVEKLNVNMRLFVNGWYFTIQNHKGVCIYSMLDYTDDLYLSYEEAAIAGIEYVIKNFI